MSFGFQILAQFFKFKNMWAWFDKWSSIPCIHYTLLKIKNYILDMMFLHQIKTKDLIDTEFHN